MVDRINYLLVVAILLGYGVWLSVSVGEVWA